MVPVPEVHRLLTTTRPRDPAARAQVVPRDPRVFLRSCPRLRKAWACVRELGSHCRSWRDWPWSSWPAWGLLAYLHRPLSQAGVDAAIQQRLQDTVTGNESVTGALFATYSGRTGALHRYAAGAARVDSRFHSASVGKTMLAAVHGQLVDEGRVTFDDPVGRWLGATVLDGLFVAGTPTPATSCSGSPSKGSSADRTARTATSWP
ncbi:serine hydrolase [Actinoplanes italicus]|uniref:serine hydrolase n=1 Tax=Actinoplanes italicus TaxID=113567 RepID=UPI0035A22D2C